MQIRRLKLSGFKSFVEPTELRIERGLTGVVGPNGCGKSNLLEAIRWVMGEGSAKSLRGAGMDDVIFAGTQSRPSRDFAEVSIHALAEREGDDGELEVVRRIERGAGSAYRINGRDVRAKDVGLLFADAATGAHSPALVSQGKISAVIAAKPVDRRAMLEEAAGISGLHVRRKDAEQKLRATETNLGRLDEVLGDMEMRIGHLRRQARAAERYRKLTDDIRVAEARLIFTRWKEAADAAEAAKAEAAQANTLVDQASVAQRTIAAQQAEQTSQMAAARSAALAARDQANEAGHHLSNRTSERAALDRRIADLAAQTERLEADRAREGALAHDAAAALERLHAETAMLDARIKAAEAGRPDLASQLARAEAVSRDAEIALAQALSAQAREQAETRVADAAVAAAAVRLERVKRERTQLEAQALALGDEAPLSAALATARAAQDQAQADSAAAQEQVRLADAARDDAFTRRDAAQSTLSTAQAALAALDSEAKALEKTVATNTSSNRLIDKITAQPGYERALAAALGDDLDAAIGTTGARFWSGADIQEADPQLPASMHPLSDYVSAPDSIMRRLAQVGVVGTDDGGPLAVGQRIVTLAGTMRRWDGYVAVDQGAAAAERLVRLNRLVVLRSERESAALAVEEARAMATSAQAAMDQARATADAGRRAQADADNRARAAIRDMDAASAALERLANRRAEMAERLERVQADAQEAEQEVTQAQAVRQALPDGSATNAHVTQLQAGAEAARGAVARLRAESAGLDRAISEDGARLASAHAEMKAWSGRAGEAAKRIEEMTRRARAVESEALSLADAPAHLDQKIAALSEQLTRLQAEANLAAEAERAVEAKLRETETQLAAAGEALSAAREARAGAVARAENQELRRIEMGRVSGERFECPPPLLPQRAGFDADTIRTPQAESAQLERLNSDRERIGPVNLVAEKELQEIEGGRVKTLAERDELTEAVNRLRGSIGSLNREGRARLLAAFEDVNGHFQRLFTTLFNGGQAHLALVDSDDPLEAGLEIFAQPPGKRLQSLTLLSGGEQALTAVALIFGLFLTNPAPICVLDEVDAPLDDANIERFCDLLDAMTQETQTRYLIVTHNAVTMSRMHRLFGVTMVEQGVSRLVSVDLQGAEDLLATA